MIIHPDRQFSARPLVMMVIGGWSHPGSISTATIEQSSRTLHSRTVCTTLSRSATYFCLVARELLTGAWNTPPNDTSSSIEGGAAIQRPWLLFSVSGVSIIHVQAPCAVWLSYHFNWFHTIQSACEMCRIVSNLPPEFRYWCHHECDRFAPPKCPSKRLRLLYGSCSEGSPNMTDLFHPYHDNCCIDDTVMCTTRSFE